jgi:hypothetical protein
VWVRVEKAFKIGLLAAEYFKLILDSLFLPLSTADGPALGSPMARRRASQQNLNYYANLAHYYTIYDLRRMKPEQVHLYLLCYAWKRYRQLNDNLIDALCYHMKQLEDETKEKAENNSPSTKLTGNRMHHRSDVYCYSTSTKVSTT